MSILESDWLSCLSGYEPIYNAKFLGTESGCIVTSDDGEEVIMTMAEDELQYNNTNPQPECEEIQTLNPQEQPGPLPYAKMMCAKA